MKRSSFDNIFPSLSAASRDFLENHSMRKIVAKNEQFLWEGDTLENVYVILDGYVKVYRFSGEGREQSLAMLKSGQFVNVVPALRQEKENHANAIAMTEIELGILSVADFISALHTYPDFAVLLLKDSANKLDHLTRLAEELSLFSTRQRLIHFLLEQGKEKDEVKGWTQEEIASQVGTVRDVVSRLLGLFAREGLIRVERQRIIIVDEERLLRAFGKEDV